MAVVRYAHDMCAAGESKGIVRTVSNYLEKPEHGK